MFVQSLHSAYLINLIQVSFRLAVWSVCIIRISLSMLFYLSVLWSLLVNPAGNSSRNSRMKYWEKVWNLFKVDNSDTRTTSVFLKVTVRQIEKPLINDCLRVSKISWKFCIPTIYNFAVIYPWNLLFFEKVPYILTVSIVFSFINKILRLNNLKTRIAVNATISVFVICVQAIIYCL